jgi:hypothetical protein
MEIPAGVELILIVGGLVVAVLMLFAVLRIFSIDQSLKDILTELRNRRL